MRALLCLLPLLLCLSCDEIFTDPVPTDAGLKGIGEACDADDECLSGNCVQAACAPAPPPPEEDGRRPISVTTVP